MHCKIETSTKIHSTNPTRITPKTFRVTNNQPLSGPIYSKLDFPNPYWSRFFIQSYPTKPPLVGLHTSTVPVYRWRATARLENLPSLLSPSYLHFNDPDTYTIILHDPSSLQPDKTILLYYKLTPSSMKNLHDTLMLIVWNQIPIIYTTTLITSSLILFATLSLCGCK